MRRKPRKYKPIPLPKLDAKAIGQRLRVLRMRRNWYQVQVADMAGVDNTVITKIESGERLPSRDVMLALSTIFKVRLDYVLLGLGSRKKVCMVH